MKYHYKIDFGQCIRLIEETSVIGKEELELFIERSMFQIEQNRVDEDTEGRSPSVFGRKRLRVRALSVHGSDVAISMPLILNVSGMFGFNGKTKQLARRVHR